MVSESPGCAQLKLSQQLATLSQTQATGKLVLNQGDRRWQFYFILGQLIYAVDDWHRVRRWHRAWKQYCRHFQFDAKQVSEANLWEYKLLQQGVNQSQLSAQHAKAAIAAVVKEVLFAAFAHPDATSRWLPSRQSFDTSQLPSLVLSPPEFDRAIEPTQQMWQQWQAMGLSYLSPDFAPIWQTSANHRVSPDSVLKLNKIFNGQNTLWDIAIKRKQSVLETTRTLHHFVQQKTIAMRQVPDLPSPNEQLRLVSMAVNPSKPLIACIDDSVVTGKTLETILSPAGYRILNIQDPLRQMSELVERKPALIFLDLMMPDADGFALCSFLRQTASFREVPIIILTSHDGMVERVRANLKGATDFLRKPPQPDKLLQLLEQYLPVEPSPLFPIASPAMA